MTTFVAPGSAHHRSAGSRRRHVSEQGRRARHHAAGRRFGRRPARRHSRRPGWFVTWLQYLTFRAVIAVPSVLPLPVAMRLGEAIAYLVYLVDRRHRRVGLTNLRIAFPERSLAKRRRILRASWLNLGRMFAEVCHMRRMTAENVSERVGFEDAAYWRGLMEAHGRTGALVLTAHFGNWELFAHAHGMYGYPVHLVYRALRNPRIDAFLDRLRRAGGTATLRKSAAGASMVRAIREGKIIVIPADQNSTRGIGVFVDFFGMPASTNRGLARLALRTGLPVYPAFLVREGSTARHRIVIGERVPIARTGDLAADTVENTQRFARIIEDMITRHPDHWLWVHKRWKTRPWGSPPVY